MSIIFDYSTNQWNLDDEDRKEIFSLFGNINLNAFLQDTRIWLVTNSKRRKKDFKRFLYNWIKRSSDTNFYKAKPKKKVSKKIVVQDQSQGSSFVPKEMRNDYSNSLEIK